MPQLVAAWDRALCVECTSTHTSRSLRTNSAAHCWHILLAHARLMQQSLPLFCQWQAERGCISHACNSLKHQASKCCSSQACSPQQPDLQQKFSSTNACLPCVLCMLAHQLITRQRSVAACVLLPQVSTHACSHMQHSPDSSSIAIIVMPATAWLTESAQISRVCWQHLASQIRVALLAQPFGGNAAGSEQGDLFMQKAALQHHNHIPALIKAFHGARTA